MMILVSAANRHIDAMETLTRPMDQKEVEEATGLSFHVALFTLRGHLEGVKALINPVTEELLGIGGVQYINSYAVPWLILTVHIEKQKMAFLRYSKRYTENVLIPEFGELTNLVYKENKLHIDWLTWLGATWLPYNDKFDQFILTERR